MSKFKIVETEKYFKYEINSVPGARMLFTTRRGGISGGRYASLNMGYSTNDEKENIYKNRQAVLDDFGLSISDMVSSDQVHGIKLVSVKDGGMNCGKCDGIFTEAGNVVLCMYFADCVPLFFYDVKKRVIGLVHAGWRGTCNGIASRSVEYMRQNHGSDPADIRAVIGPSISQCCFEVGPEVAREFMQKIERSIVEENISESRSGSFYINLKAINRALIRKSGIDDGGIFMHEACTSCMNDVFYSYRRDKTDTGRMAGLAFIN